MTAVLVICYQQTTVLYQVFWPQDSKIYSKFEKLITVSSSEVNSEKIEDIF